MYTDNKMTNKKSPKNIIRWIWIIISSVFVFWVLVYELDWKEVSDAVEQANYVWVSAGILITILAIFVRTWRWQVLLYRFETRVFGIMSALLIGQAVNLVLPLRSGDVMRVIWFRELYGSSGSEALGTVAIEKVWDVLALLVCGIFMVLLIPLPESYIQTIWITFMLLAIGLSILLAGIRWQKPIVNSFVKATSKLSQ